MKKIIIEKVKIEDLEILRTIGQTTFNETFANSNSEENMQQYLKENFALEKLKTELTNENSEFYFAKFEDTVLGYLKINFAQAQTELQSKDALEIERIYVLEAYHGKKIGQLLFEKAIEIAVEKNANYVWLGVWEENHRALAFYKKNGFIEFDKHIFHLGDDAQTDIMMKLVLK